MKILDKFNLGHKLLVFLEGLKDRHLDNMVKKKCDYLLVVLSL